MRVIIIISLAKICAIDPFYNPGDYTFFQNSSDPHKTKSLSPEDIHKAEQEFLAAFPYCDIWKAIEAKNALIKAINQQGSDSYSDQTRICMRTLVESKKSDKTKYIDPEALRIVCKELGIYPKADTIEMKRFLASEKCASTDDVLNAVQKIQKNQNQDYDFEAGCIRGGVNVSQDTEKGLAIYMTLCYYMCLKFGSDYILKKQPEAEEEQSEDACKNKLFKKEGQTQESQSVLREAYEAAISAKSPEERNRTNETLLDLSRGKQSKEILSTYSCNLLITSISLCFINLIPAFAFLIPMIFEIALAIQQDKYFLEKSLDKQNIGLINPIFYLFHHVFYYFVFEEDVKDIMNKMNKSTTNVSEDEKPIILLEVQAAKRKLNLYLIIAVILANCILFPLMIPMYIKLIKVNRLRLAKAFFFFYILLSKYMSITTSKANTMIWEGYQTQETYVPNCRYMTLYISLLKYSMYFGLLFFSQFILFIFNMQFILYFITIGSFISLCVARAQ